MYSLFRHYQSLLKTTYFYNSIRLNNTASEAITQLSGNQMLLS